ncbi:MAG: c-type cytochrome [Caulobacterales bacterium]
MHRTRHLALAALAIVAVLGAGAAASAQSVANGRALVVRNCGMCHAVGATDDSPNPASPPFRDLHKRYPVENLAEALAEGILTGHPQMPEFRFAPSEVNDIIAFLKSIQSEQHARSDSRAPSNGGHAS